MIRVTFKPAAWIPLKADSRPAPGPLIRTSTVLIPCSMAFLTASSAANWAAKGVDLREPLKPWPPAVAQAMVLPWGSVMVTLVLLKVAWMWAIPVGTFFFSFFLPLVRLTVLAIFTS